MGPCRCRPALRRYTSAPVPRTSAAWRAWARPLGWALLCCAAGVSTWTTSARAQDGAAALAAQVEVVRTAHGVPHIYADTFEALGYALGYLQVEDYGERAPLGLLRARGELAQVLNPPGGYVRNENDGPWLTNLRAPLDPADYPGVLRGAGIPPAQPALGAAGGHRRTAVAREGGAPQAQLPDAAGRSRQGRSPGGDPPRAR